MSEQTKTDAEFLRALKYEGLPASCEEVRAHNQRLEIIAKRLETENRLMEQAIEVLENILALPLGPPPPKFWGEWGRAVQMARETTKAYEVWRSEK